MKHFKEYLNNIYTENSVKELTNTAIPEKIVEFIKKHPFPLDHAEWHKFAESINIESEALEEYAYAFLTLLFCGGASKGKDIEVSKENLKIGMEIEAEHCFYETDNKVLNKMQDIIKRKIVNDHIAEKGNENYYVYGINFIEQLANEKQKEKK